MQDIGAIAEAWLALPATVCFEHLSCANSGLSPVALKACVPDAAKASQVLSELLGLEDIFVLFVILILFLAGTSTDHSLPFWLNCDLCRQHVHHPN